MYLVSEQSVQVGVESVMVREKVEIESGKEGGMEGSKENMLEVWKK